jgi:hypothetical protein
MEMLVDVKGAAPSVFMPKEMLFRF